MSILLYIIISTFSISLIAFLGSLTLFLKEELLNKTLLILVSFSAGTLIGNSFLHLIPEAIEMVEADQVFNLFLYVLLGFCVFFVLESLIKWHHHHAKEHPEVMPFSYLILFSDAIHNFIDGLIIAATFLASIPLGIASSLAVAFHEIPQEIGDFGVLIHGGFKKRKALFLNFLSAITVVLGGLVGFLISAKIGESIVFLLPFAAGGFIYIASSDLIPEIKNEKNIKNSIIYFFVFLAGLALMLMLKLV
ncbi:MAG: ZIP family metal transporter [Patescibacteria group bacterium]|nr:ZIP family metal transporter [Patescibacteria group bacterium]